jgi:cellulose synthase/poly-beta-1,6-N-acetylglucosamine synthase-like glycosyltransferase
MTGDDIKILYLDDDSLPSKEYIEKCFLGDYDIMEGIIQPKRNYGTRYSYVENSRTLSCMSTCSAFQSHGHPVWVHGEGICIKASTEQIVKWQFRAIASEDLIFGHQCTTNKLKWGFVWESVYITSPWNLKDYFKQRNRWFWGHVNAIRNILTWQSCIRILFFRFIGVMALWISTIGIILDLTGALNFSSNERILFMVSLACWLGLYGYIGYEVGNKKVKHVVLSMALAWYASFMNVVPIFVSLYLGKPKKFEVITKDRVTNNRQREQSMLS